MTSEEIAGLKKKIEEYLFEKLTGEINTGSLPPYVFNHLQEIISIYPELEDFEIICDRSNNPVSSSELVIDIRKKNMDTIEDYNLPKDYKIEILRKVEKQNEEILKLLKQILDEIKVI